MLRLDPCDELRERLERFDDEDPVCREFDTAATVRGGSCGDRSRRREIVDPGTPWDDPARADVLDDDCDVNDDASECCMGTTTIGGATSNRG